MNPFESAQKQLEDVRQYFSEDEQQYFEFLKLPQRVLEFALPVKMDDGKWKLFQGYRVQYNNARGPYKGGLRYHPQVDINEVKALSFWMAIKTAVVNIPLGGSKGGIQVDPSQLSEAEKERLTRTFARSLADFIGPEIDVPAPDVYTNAQIMEWIADEYSKVKGKWIPGVITGKPLEKGGSLGRHTATAQGAFYVLEELIKQKNLNKNDLKIAIQGFGNAGSIMAKILHDYRYKVVAVSDSKSGLYDEEGLDIPKVIDYKEEHKSFAGYEGAQAISNEQLLVLDCDVLIPAALENQVTADNSERVKAKIILELANGPTTPAADSDLESKQVVVVPDVLANAGGVTVSYFELVQNLADEKWTEEQVNQKLKKTMQKSFEDLWKTAVEKNVSLRKAAFILAVRRIIESIKQKNQ